MSRNRKLNRKNRNFHIESLERREMMSATGWSAHDGDHSAADAASLTAYVATADRDQNLTPSHTERMLAPSATATPTALVRAQQEVPYTVTKNGATLQITATKAGYGIKVKNYFKNPQSGKVTLTIEHFGPQGGPFAQPPIDVTGITKIVYKGTNGNDAFDNDTGLLSEQWGYSGNDTLLGGWKMDILHGGSGNDHLNGRNGHDELYGGKNGSIPIGSGAGRLGDELYGGNGNDTLDGGAGNDYLNGHADTDTAINPQPGDELISIERVKSVKLTAAAITQTPDGGGANPAKASPSAGAVITVASATGTIQSDDSVPEAKLTKGRLIIQGGNFADTVSVNLAGNEVVVNFNGREKQFAAASVKSLEFHGAHGDDRFTNNTSIAARPMVSQGMDKLIGGSGNDVLRGGDGKDWIDGREGNDELYGAGDDDTLLGGAGDDRLFGGDGTDHIDGGAGNDHLRRWRSVTMGCTVATAATSSSARKATIGCMAAAATTSSTATSALTGFTVTPATTSCVADRAMTSCTAAPAMTTSMVTRTMTRSTAMPATTASTPATENQETTSCSAAWA